MEQLTDFQRWWNEFPLGNGFKYKGRHFKRTRALRLAEDKCKKKFNEILKKGITLEQMLTALNREIESRYKESYQTGLNKMTFMSNSQAYLNSGQYEAWFEDSDPEYGNEETKLVNPEDLF